MLKNLRSKISEFISTNKEYPIISAIAAGLYPLLYYYNSNFTLVNSWNHLLYFLFYFLIVPAVIIYLIYRLAKKIDIQKKFINSFLTFSNLLCFGLFMLIGTYGFDLKIFLIILLVSLVLAVLLNSHLKKIVVFQYLMAISVFVMLLPEIYTLFSSSKQWMEQPDKIENVQFKKKPNIYVIQPDGYANFSELNKGFYNYDNTEFEKFLENNEFTLYNNFRSNYISTLTSNASMFGMKHHYYNNTAKSANEFYNARQIIVGDNPVISTFKNNNYKTFLMLEYPYLLLNKPKLGYDYCNIDYNEVSFLTRGFDFRKNVSEDLAQSIEENKETNNFYFIRKSEPSHITISKNKSEGIEGERENYLSELKTANSWLMETINMINEKDNNALIVIVADHGGFVGLNYLIEHQQKQTDRDIIYSMFTSALAIKWPDGNPDYNEELKTPVNLFRVLFSHLSEDNSYLNSMQYDRSYCIIYRGAPYGVYEYIDENGEVNFKNISENAR